MPAVAQGLPCGRRLLQPEPSEILGPIGGSFEPRRLGEDRAGEFRPSAKSVGKGFELFCQGLGIVAAQREKQLMGRGKMALL